MVVWLKSCGRDLRLVDSFVPRIYIRGKDLERVRSRLFSRGIRSGFVKKKSFFLGKEQWVLEVPVEKLSSFHHIVNRIERWFDFSLELYNADLKLEEHYMFDKGLFPTAKVSFEVENNRIVSINALDDAEELDYSLPKFKVADLKVKTADNLFKGMDSELVAVFFGNKLYKSSEQEILNDFKKAFEKKNPDIIWIENGNLILPFLKEKFREYNIDFCFNRFEKDDFEFKQGDVYTSYGRVFYRSHSIFLRGRLHFDARAFFADDTGLHGIVDGARVARQRIQRTEMRSAGACVTNMLLYTAWKMDFLLPYKTGMYERFKTMYQLYQADRGACIFEPRVGFHNHVTEFDFVSLYPNIMNKYNLSPETLFCKCCKDKVPGLHYHFCQKTRGVVPIVAEKLIRRRITLKKKGTPESKQKCDYIKWLLVTMFGYQAFKGKKIGIIEIHESIQAYARQVIMKSCRAAENLGWDVVHGIIDSVYVKKRNFSKKELEIVEKEIFNATGMEVKHEGNYRWIVFLPSLVNPNVPVPTRYYGVFEDGELKCRGIEAIRKDCPPIVAKMQKKMIELLAKAKTEDEFRRLFPSVFELLKKYVAALDHATKDELAIVKMISKLDYSGSIAQGIVVSQMIEEGYDVKPGQAIAYIIRDVKHKDPRKRYISLDRFSGEFDKQKYIEFLVRATFSILQPFDISMDLLFELVKNTKQIKLDSFNVLVERKCVEDSP